MFKKEEVDKLAQKVAEAIGEDLLTYTPDVKDYGVAYKSDFGKTIQGTTAGMAPTNPVANQLWKSILSGISLFIHCLIDL